MNRNLSLIEVADQAFYEIFHDFNFLDYMNPINSFQEAERFFEAWGAKKEYNPQYEYRPIPRKIKVWKDRLQTFSFGTTLLDEVYQAARGEFLTILSLVESRGTSAVTEFSVQLFGTPSEGLLTQAKRDLKTGRNIEWLEPQSMGVKGLAEKIRERLREDQIEGWDVMEDKDATVLALVDSSKRKIRLQTGSLFTRTMVKRLLHHEVGIHVYRAVNGAQQPYKLFALGFPKYLITEEGLALELEDRMHLQTPQVKKRYAGRVLAASLAPQYSFFDIFKRLREFFPDEDAFALAQRSKRGLKDTSQPGGFIQDHIYLLGKNLVHGLTKSDYRLLFTGKVGVDHLSLVKGMMENELLVEPSLLPGVFHG